VGGGKGSFIQYEYLGQKNGIRITEEKVGTVPTSRDYDTKKKDLNNQWCQGRPPVDHACGKGSKKISSFDGGSERQPDQKKRGGERGASHVQKAQKQSARRTVGKELIYGQSHTKKKMLGKKKLQVQLGH